MYQSPIEITRTVDDIATKIAEEEDKAIVHACMRVGVNVDKDELVKALAYDRGQYEKGYADGRRARDSEIVRCKYCIHGIPTRIDTVTGEFSDERYCNCHHMCHFEDYYCADGERKETEDGAKN